MKPTTWRAIILMCCAITAIAAIAQIVDATGAAGKPGWYGILGYGSNAAGPFKVEVHSIDPGGPAQRAGIQVGDVIDFSSSTLIGRIGYVTQPMSGVPIVLHVRRGSQLLQINIVPAPANLSRLWNLLLGPLGTLWLLLFASLIVRRRTLAHGNLLLSLVLVSIAAGTAFVPNWLVTPWPWAYVLFALLAQAGLLAIALSAAFAGSFAQPVSRLRRVTQWFCYGLVAISLAINLAAVFGTVTARLDPFAMLYSPIWQIPTFAAVVMAQLCSILAIAAARGLERHRAAWSLIPIAFFYAMFAGSSLIDPFLSYGGAVVMIWLVACSVAALPVALTYAAVSRRLIDIGFVLNRAAVYAIISTIVVGAFVLVEWAASEWLVNASHSTSAIVGAAVALVLGLSMRHIHAFVDGFVDRVFFRKRHENEAALRAFGHEAAYITDRSVLLERAVQEVRDHTDADDASILLLDGNASYDENDPALVAMRAWHKPIDLHTQPNSALKGELAFPMVSRGQLVGVLICGPKRDGESYAPDETEALRALAHGVGTALDTLFVQKDDRLDLILRKLDNLERTRA